MLDVYINVCLNKRRLLSLEILRRTFWQKITKGSEKPRRNLTKFSPKFWYISAELQNVYHTGILN
jgi:hypothetical protein